MPSISESFENVNKAFTRQSEIYDDYDRGNPTLTWMRHMVRKHALKFLRTDDKILELNSGTGIDAVYFARLGFKVHCTDLSDGMIDQMKIKFSTRELAEKITVQQCSFTELNKIGDQKFDFIFSNFGGLNCVDDLKKVTKFFPDLLNKNGRICLVILPPVCPWEIIQLFRGKFSLAFRRFHKEGVFAHVEGIKFKTYYFSKKDIMSSLGKKFRLLSVQSLGVFTPIPQMQKIPLDFPRFAKALNKIDEYVSGIYPFNRIGDHIIVTAEYIGV